MENSLCSNYFSNKRSISSAYDAESSKKKMTSGIIRSWFLNSFPSRFLKKFFLPFKICKEWSGSFAGKTLKYTFRQFLWDSVGRFQRGVFGMSYRGPPPGASGPLMGFRGRHGSTLPPPFSCGCYDALFHESPFLLIIIINFWR